MDFVGTAQTVSTAGAKSNNGKKDNKALKNNIPVKPAQQKTKTAAKKAHEADYLQAEDFSGDLPKPSLLSSSKNILMESEGNASASETSQVSEGVGGGSSLTTDSDFPYPWYITKVREALYNAWSAKMTDTTNMQCTVAFTILLNGTIKNVRVEKSSGNRLFDNAAETSVKMSAPFERLPDDFYEDTLTIHVEFKSTV